jgi:AraC family transcriptional regulator
MRSSTRQSYIECVTAAVEALAINLDAPPALTDLAAEACLSPFHFHRIFRGMVGESPGEFVRRLRLERAAYRLMASPDPITEIAFEAGYQAHEAFTRAFRAAYNRSPRECRHGRHLQIELASTSGVHFNPRGEVPTFVPRDTGGKDMHVDIIDRPAMRMATLRHIGPYNQISATFGRLCEVAAPAGLFREGALVLAVYHDDPESTPPSELRSDAAILLVEDTPCPQGLVEQTLPGGAYARYSHIGPYEQLGDVWARFMGEWLPNSGYRMGEGTTYEIYMNDPEEVPPSEIHTDLYIPVAK